MFFGLLIPILALSIPIIAILSKSPIGHAIADSIRAGNADRAPGTQSVMSDHELKLLKARIEELEAVVAHQDGEIRKISDDYRFITRLLEDKSK